MKRFTSNLAVVLAMMIGAAGAQVGQPADRILNNPVIKESKSGAGGIYTTKDGSALQLNIRGDYLLSALLMVPDGLPTTKTSGDGLSVSGGTGSEVMVADGAKAKDTGLAKAAKLIAILGGFGDDFNKAFVDYLSRPEVIASLPKGVPANAGPYALKMQAVGKMLRVSITMGGVQNAAIVSSNKVIPAKNTSVSPVILRIYSDFQCPACQKFEAEVWPELKRRLPEYITVEFHDFPIESIHPLARPTAEASECAAMQGKFWEFKDMLFSDRSWMSANPSAVYVSHASKVGLDTKKFQECLDTRGGKGVVDANLNNALAIGINSTPSLMINNYKVANPYDINAIMNQIGFARAASGAPASMLDPKLLPLKP